MIRLQQQLRTRTFFFYRKSIIFFSYLFLSLFAFSVFASNLKINPVRLQMRHNDQITLLDIKNQGEQPVNVQIIPHTWGQVSGEDILTPTSDILIIPPLFSLNPGSTHSIRIARRNIINSGIEQNYRLIIKEFDTIAGENNNPGLRLMLNISLPLFIEPETINTNHVWKIESKTPLIKRITLINKSNVHAVLTDIKLANEHGEVVSEPLSVLSYILPFQSKEWNISTIGPVEDRQLKVLSNISFPEKNR